MSNSNGLAEDFISTITALPFNLYMVGMEKSMVPQFAHQLIQIIFFAGRSRFYSYTETPDEVSIILDEKSLALFPRSAFESGALKLASHTPWKAITLTLGASPLVTGIVRTISTPLGQAGISIIYCSTFNNDYILVEKHNYEKARECLKQRFPLLWTDAEEDESDSPVLSFLLTQPTQSSNGNEIQFPNNQQQPQTPTLSATNLAQAIMDLPLSKSPPTSSSFSSSSTVDAQKIKQLQALPALSVALCRIRVESLENIALDLLQLLFYPKSSNEVRFISFTRAEDDELSLMLDKQTMTQFNRTKLQAILDETWIPVRRLHKFGFQETGIVAKLSTPLTQVSILYLSCYKTSYILVHDADFERAVSLWKDSDFIVTKQ